MKYLLDAAVDWTLDLAVALMVAAAVVLAPLAVYAMIQEQKQWDAFALKHDCRVTERVPARTTYGSGSVGGKYATTTNTEPARTAYKCDDGVTYWR